MSTNDPVTVSDMVGTTIVAFFISFLWSPINDPGVNPEMFVIAFMNIWCFRYLYIKVKNRFSITKL